MGTKMKKGILKPIRYISQIFDNKEPEMQIGFPTEVKHVAHIGWDGPNANAPTWMKEYHSAPLNTSSCGSEGESPNPNLWGSQGSDFSCGGLEDCPPVDDSAPPPTRPRHTRRHKSDETSSRDVVIDSAHGGDSSADGSKKSRKGRKSKDSGGGSQDMPAIPKQSHRRRSKDSSGGGSVRTSKSKASASKSSDAAAAEEGSSKPATSLDYGFGAEEQ